MVAVYTGTLKWSPIGKCLSLKRNSSGVRSCKPYITVIRGTWLTGISSWKTSCSMRRRKELRWSILASVLASHMSVKLKFSVERLLIWHQRSWARLSTQGHRLISGPWESSYMLFSVVNSHSEARTIKNCTTIFEHKIFSFLTTCRHLQDFSSRNYLTKLQSVDRLQSKSCRTRGLKSVPKSMRCWVQLSCMVLESKVTMATRRHHKDLIRLRDYNRVLGLEPAAGVDLRSKWLSIHRTLSLQKVSRTRKRIKG